VKRIGRRQSDGATTLDDPDQDDDDGHDDEYVDEPSHGGAGHKTKGPEDEEDDCDCH
jgi:hypothetical protein